MNPTRNPRRAITQGVLVATLTLASWSPSFGADPAAVPVPVNAPTRIILTWNGDPARTQAVTWRTETPVGSPQAQIAPLTPNPKFQSSTVAGTARLVPRPEGKSAAHYVVKFQDLNPGTKYSYRVGDGSTWSEWNVFQTAQIRPDPFRFIYLGDAQNNLHSLWSRAVRAAFATAPDARFIIHAGDLVADGFDDRLWMEWCEAMGFISAMVPSLPVPGNHDRHRVPVTPAVNDPLTVQDIWHQHFALPANGPEALPGQSYYVDYQGVRFVSCDNNAFGGPADPSGAKERVAEQEIVWLDKVLRENPNRWTVVFSHYPVYPIAKQRSRFVQLESRLVPLYDKYHVDLVLQGHDHGYGRTYKLRGGKVVADGEPGTIYTVSVSGTKMYEINPAAPEVMAKTLAGAQLFQIISVSQQRLLYEAYTIDGVVIDSFELRKPAGAGAAK